MTAKRNPYVGMHPDLFSLQHGYPLDDSVRPATATPSMVARVHPSKRAVELTEAEAARMAAAMRGETPVFVPLDQLDSEAIRSLPRSSFTDAEWDELADGDRDYISANDEASEQRVDDMVSLFVNRWKGETERASQGDESNEEYFHEVLGNENHLENWMPTRRRNALHSYGDHRGLDEDDVDRIIRDVMADTSNYSSEVGFNVANSVWSTDIDSQLYVSSDEWKQVVEGMYEDEIARALKRIYKGTDKEIDISRDRLTRNRDVEIEFTTGLEQHFVADWQNISDQVESGIDAEADVREREASEAPPLPDVAAPPVPRPEQPIAYQWPDGFYVADLVEDDKEIDAVQAAGILGVPIKQKDAKKGGPSLEKLIKDGMVEYFDQPAGTFSRGRIAMRLESMDMGHCVGDANMGYMDAVRDGDIKILSLRRPSGKPLFTMEAELDKATITKFEQIKGKGNRVPGFDRGMQRAIYQSKAEAEPVIKAFKRDEVQRVIEFLDSKPGHWDGRYLDIVDLQPALFVIAELVKEGDPWAVGLLKKYPTLLGAEPDKWVVITAEAGARQWTADSAEHAREQHMDAFPDEKILSIEPKTGSRIEPQWTVVMTTGVERTFYAATEEEAYDLAARAFPGETPAGAHRANPSSSCAHGQCDGFCLPYRRRTVRNPPKMVTVYHRTTPAVAEAIRRTGKLISRENTQELFVSNRRDGHSTGYGTEVIELRVPASSLRLDDEFPDGEQHFAIKLEDAARAVRNPPRHHFKFEGTEEVLESVRDAEPTHEFIEAPDQSKWRPSDLHPVRNVTWLGSKGYLVAIPVENILFMEGNIWNFGHAAALLEGIRDGSNRVLQAPAGRVYRVMASDVKQTEKYERNGELSYQVGMTEPWTKAEIGQYHAQLLDGNHRAAAAILAGDPYIYVYVAENSRENVRKKDFE